MTEPTTSAAAAGIAAAKYGVFAKLSILFGAGAVGALLIAAVDPAEAEPDKRKRRKLIFLQVLTASVTATMCTPAAVRFLDSAFEWIDTSGSIERWAEIGLPVGLVIGGLSWGVLGAAVKLRAMIRDRGADVVADKAGLK